MRGNAALHACAEQLVVGIAGRAAAAARAVDPAALVVRDADALVHAIVGGAAASVRAFCPEDALDIALIGRATEAAAAADSMLGIVPVGPGASPQATLRVPDPGRSIVVYSDAIDGRHEAGRATFLGAPADLPGELRAGAAAIVLHTHSNGADHRIGPDVLCVQADALRPPRALAGERCFPCQAGGGCLRELVPVRRYFGAAALRAPVVVMISCTGLVPANGIVDFRFGLVAALLRAGVRAVVASFQVHSVGVEVALAAARYLDGGATVGALAAMLNEVTPVPSYVCLGDPDLVLDPVLREGTLQRPRLRPAQASAALTAVTSSTATPLRRFHAQVVSRLSDAEKAPPAIARVEALTGALDGGGEPDSELDRQFAAHLADGVARGAFLYKDWQQDLPLVPEVDTGARHACGERLLAYRAASPSFPGVERIVWTCQRCGHVADTPGDVAPIWPTGSTIDLRALCGEPAWIATVLEPVGALREPVHGPRWAEGEVELATAAVHEQPGLRWLGVIVVWSGQFAVIRHPLEAR